MSPTLDFDYVCRLCMILIEGARNEVFVPLFRGHQSLELAKKIADIADVELNAGDGLPGQVCHSCMAHVDSCHSFRQKCRNSDEHFRQYISGKYNDSTLHVAPNDTNSCFTTLCCTTSGAHPDKSTCCKTLPPTAVQPVNVSIVKEEIEIVDTHYDDACEDEVMTEDDDTGKEETLVGNDACEDGVMTEDDDNGKDETIGGVAEHVGHISEEETIDQSAEHCPPTQPVRHQQPSEFINSPVWKPGGETIQMRELLNNVSTWLAGGEMYPRPRIPCHTDKAGGNTGGRLVLPKSTNISIISQRKGDRTNSKQRASAMSPVENAPHLNSRLSTGSNNINLQKKKKYRSFVQIQKETEVSKLAERRVGVRDESSHLKYKSKCESETETRPVPKVMYELGECTITQCSTNNAALNNGTKVKLEKGSLADCTVYEMDSSVVSFDQSSSIEVANDKYPNPAFETPHQSNNYSPFIHDLDGFGFLGRNRFASKNFQCDICSKTLGSESSLKVHKLNHTGIKPFQCNIESCTKSFAQYGNLQTHIRSHLGIKPYVCKTCGTSFVQLANLQSHERKHSGIKPYTCQFCNASFAHMSSLHSHVVWYHSDHMNFECALCGRRFKSKSILIKHVSTVHGGKQQ